MKAPVKSGQGRGSAKWDPPDEEWLEHQHLTLRKSINAIHKETGAHWETVAEWLRTTSVPFQEDGRHSQASEEESPSWRGGKWWYWHKQARLVMQQHPEIPRRCACCDIGPYKAYLDVHHKNHDVCNNSLDNLQYLCKSCHKLAHPEKDSTRKARPYAKLSMSDVLEIRYLHATGECTRQELVDEFSVHRRTISDVVNKVTWTWLKDEDLENERRLEL